MFGLGYPRGLARLQLTAALALGLGVAGPSCAPQVTSVGEWEPELSWYFEAEDGVLSDGFSVSADNQASERAFLQAPEQSAADTAPGLERATYVFSLPAAGDYELWGRIRSPSASSNRYWFRVDQGPWYKWRISVGDIWYWDDFHDDTDYGQALRFELAAGEHTLELADCVSGVALDRLRISAVGETPPDNDTRCKPPHSIELEKQCFPSCGSQLGTSCSVDECAGKEILEAYDCNVCCRVEP